MTQYTRQYVSSNELRAINVDGFSVKYNAEYAEGSYMSDDASTEEWRLTGRGPLSKWKHVAQETTFYNVAFLQENLQAVANAAIQLTLKSRKDDLVWSESVGTYDHGMFEAGFDDCFQTIEALPVKPVVTLCNIQPMFNARTTSADVATGGIASVVLCKLITDLGYSVRVLNHYVSQEVDDDGKINVCTLAEIQASEQAVDLDSLAYYACDSRYMRSFALMRQVKPADDAGKKIGYGSGRAVNDADELAKLATESLAQYGITDAMLLNRCTSIEQVIAEVNRVIAELNARHA